MARRRKLRSALSGGFYGLQGFMQYLMLLEQEKRRQQMTLERQRESDVAGLSSNLIMESLRDPQFAQRASTMGKLGKLDLSTLAPPQAALGKPLLDLLAAAKSRADLPGPRQAVEVMRSSGMNVDPTLEKVSSPSEEGSIPSVQFQPGSPAPVSNLLAAREERVGGIEAAELAAAKLEEDKARYAALGRGRGEEVVTSETHPALLARKGEEEALETDVLSRREDVLRRGKIQTAAGEEGARVRARKTVELDPIIVKKEIERDVEKARLLISVELMKSAEMEKMKTLMKSGEAGAKLQTFYLRGLDLSKRVNTAKPEELLTRVGKKVGSVTQFDTDANELDRISNSAGILTIQLLGDTSGRYSEADQKIGASMWFRSFDTADVRERKAEQLRKLFIIAPRVVADLPATATPLERLQYAERLIKGSQSTAFDKLFPQR